MVQAKTPKKENKLRKAHLIQKSAEKFSDQPFFLEGLKEIWETSVLNFKMNNKLIS